MRKRVTPCLSPICGHQAGRMAARTLKATMSRMRIGSDHTNGSRPERAASGRSTSSLRRPARTDWVCAIQSCHARSVHAGRLPCRSTLGCVSCDGSGAGDSYLSGPSAQLAEAAQLVIEPHRPSHRKRRRDAYRANGLTTALIVTRASRTAWLKPVAVWRGYPSPCDGESRGLLIPDAPRPSTCM